jgi:hypothetical protein
LYTAEFIATFAQCFHPANASVAEVILHQKLTVFDFLAVNICWIYDIVEKILIKKSKRKWKMK